jgi:hypothetical protein
MYIPPLSWILNPWPIHRHNMWAFLSAYARSVHFTYCRLSVQFFDKWSKCGANSTPGSQYIFVTSWYIKHWYIPVLLVHYIEIIEGHSFPNHTSREIWDNYSEFAVCRWPDSVWRLRECSVVRKAGNDNRMNWETTRNRHLVIPRYLSNI